MSFYDDNYLKFHNMSFYFIFSIKYFDYLLTIHRDSFLIITLRNLLIVNVNST